MTRPFIYWLLAALVCLGICLYASWFPLGQWNDPATRVSANLNAVLEEVSTEADEIIKKETVTWSSLDHSFFLWNGNEIKGWSKNDFVPDVRFVQGTFDTRLLQVPAGDFLLRKWVVSPSEFLIAVIPLYRKYPVTNRYLISHENEQIFGKLNGKVREPSSDTGVPIFINNQVAFRFDVLASEEAQSNFAVLLSGGLAILFFLVAMSYWIRSLHRTHRYEWAFALMTAAFVLVRIAMIVTDYPTRWHHSDIFDPQKFASSSYNASMGDLVINAIGILLLCAYVFFTYPGWKSIKRLINVKTKMRWLLASVFLLFAIASFLYPFLFFETIFHNSEISLDITQTIRFDSLRVLAFASVIAGVASGFLFVHVFLRLAISFAESISQFLISFVIASIIFVVYFLSADRNYWITLAVVWLYFVIVYSTRTYAATRKITYSTFVYIFIAIGAFSLQGAWSINRFVDEEKIESQRTFGASYLINRDVLAEYLLSESATRISKDAFIQARLSSPFLGKDAVRQKIRQIYLNSYFDRYEGRIHLYNPAGESLDGPSQPGLADFTKPIEEAANKTEYAGVYFIQSNSFESIKRYIAIVSLSRMDQPAGYVVLDLSMKRIIPHNVYPELLVDSRFSQYFENRDKSFAFISNGKIQSSFGNFNYERDFDFSMLGNPQFYRWGMLQQGFLHTGVEDDSGQVAVVTSAAYPLFFVLTNFSFLFVTGLLVILLVTAGVRLISWLRGERMNYTAKIQLYIYLAFALPLLVVTVTALNRISNAAEDELNKDFQDKSRMLGENLLPSMNALSDSSVSQQNELEEQLVTLAKLAGMDMTVFHSSGSMMASSQPVIVETQLASNMMDRLAWEKTFEQGETSLIRNEQIGLLKFNNAYFGLKSPETGSLMGVLSVPFFESAFSLEATQISVLANILTVFTIIFILFSILSFYAVNALIFPLRLMTRTLSRTTLSGKNTPVEWNTKDEIGVMITEYNNMLENLEQSKVDLARSQKESAWREMAKQVAHEIKNPLTPMKLTLQQMEQLINNNELAGEKASKSVKTLLKQVEILNEIATSFSAFARMPAPILQRIELVSLVKKCTDLYGSYQEGNVTFISPSTPVFVMGDDQLLNRIFSNIILNALQAGEDKKIQVDVSIIESTGFVTVCVKDDGKGIDEELSKKVFIPYFSTKESGSGLGLAIAKQGIEQSGGEIWFESNNGAGTSFYVKLPTTA